MSAQARARRKREGKAERTGEGQHFAKGQPESLADPPVAEARALAEEGEEVGLGGGAHAATKR